MFLLFAIWTSEASTAYIHTRIWLLSVISFLLHCKWQVNAGYLFHTHTVSESERVRYTLSKCANFEKLRVKILFIVEISIIEFDFNYNYYFDTLHVEIRFKWEMIEKRKGMYSTLLVFNTHIVQICHGFWGYFHLSHGKFFFVFPGWSNLLSCVWLCVFVCVNSFFDWNHCSFRFIH